MMLMNYRRYLGALLLATLCGLLPARDRISLNKGWTFCDEQDRTCLVDLPHDYQIGQPWVVPSIDERPDDSDAAANVKSRLSARAFKECTRGVYTRSLLIPDSLRGRRLLLDFEGMMLTGDVYLNDTLVGGTDYGYLGFEIDITDHILPGENRLKVVTDTGAPNNSRWYTGGGLFREVHLVATSPTDYIARHGVWVVTPEVSRERAVVEVYAEVEAREAVEATVVLRSPAGKEVARKVTPLKVSPKQHRAEYQVARIELPAPALWDCDTPNLYTAEVTVSHPDGSPSDAFTRTFGIRDISFSPEYGFRLNGRKVLLKGIANHHTLGALGAAAYPKALEKRIRLLKQFGFNHIRTSHNPYSEQFLDLCDRYGILVVDELYDKWLTQYAGGRTDWMNQWPHDVPEWVKRDRSHPSVIVWSLGNELQTYSNLPFNDWGVTAYRLLRTLLRRYDDTRPVTVAMHPRGRSLWTDSIPAPLALETDIAAYNYRYMYFPGDGRRYPDKIFYQSEASLGGMGANFFEPDSNRVVGLAYWGMIDYLGESLGWPAKGWVDGVFDLSLQPKPRAWLLRSMFKADEPLVHIAVHEQEPAVRDWNGIPIGSQALTDHWNRQPGDTLSLTVFTNAASAELRLNGRSLGRRLNPVDNPKQRNQLTWTGVAYQPGRLEAVAYDEKGKVVARHAIETAGKAVKLVLAPDDDLPWTADGQDLQHVRVTAVDSKGRVVPMAEDEVTFEVTEGDARIVATDNGDMACDELHTSPMRSLHGGRALVILRAGSQAGKVTLSAKSKRLPAAVLQLNCLSGRK
jgi:beta-galactosidase